MMKEGIEELFREIAQAESSDVAEQISKAWKCFESGYRWLAPTDLKEDGTFRISPCYPLVLSDTTGFCMTQEEREQLHHEMKSISRAVQYFEEGCFQLEILTERISEKSREKVQELFGMCKYTVSCAKTTMHAKQWDLYKTFLSVENREARVEIVWKMRVLGEKEIRNAMDVITFADKEQIEEKIRITKNVMENELKEFMHH